MILSHPFRNESSYLRRVCGNLQFLCFLISPIPEMWRVGPDLLKQLNDFSRLLINQEVDLKIQVSVALRNLALPVLGNHDDVTGFDCQPERFEAIEDQADQRRIAPDLR